MKPVVKKLLLGAGVAVVVLGGSLVAYALPKISAYDASMAHVYDIAVPTVTRSTEPSVLARGQHLVESLTACATRDCHGSDLGGGKPIDMGPLGTISGPNLSNGLLAAYSDGELARMLQFGIKRDGTSLRMMPVQDFNWLPAADIAAIVSYLRTIPSVDRPSGPMVVKPLAKILDRRDEIIFDVARRASKPRSETPPPPEPTAAYGRFVGKLCTGCHGEYLSGGPIPGAPPSIPVPPNLTVHDSGMKDWTYEDFTKLLNTGIRKNGLALNPFMPYEALAKLNDTEKRALWEHLRSVPARPLGQR